jgi:hypothetical protein
MANWIPDPVNYPDNLQAEFLEAMRNHIEMVEGTPADEITVEQVQDYLNREVRRMVSSIWRKQREIAAAKSIQDADVS